MHDLGLGYTWEFSTTLGEVSYEVPERLAGPLGACPQVQEFPGRTYVPWKFPTKVRTRLSQLWI
jgi:hypothetical protein